MKKHSRYLCARKFLIFWCLFIGIGAVAGSVGMLTAPDGSNLGMQELLPYFQVLPFADLLFQDYVFPGISLLIVNGITNLVASVFLFMKRKIGIVLGGIFGLTLMAWITIQFVIFPANFMSTIYFIFGISQAITGYITWVFYKQETFCFVKESYTNIGTNSKNLVVYFSRLSFTRKVAYEEANKTGAEIYEITTPERTEGTLGFWWCGRFGMHAWPMSIDKINIDLSKYEHITICTPIWVFTIASPIRGFCKEVSGEIKDVDYILVHHTPWKYQNAKKEMDTLLGVESKGTTSICCHMGRIVKKVSF